MRGKEMTRGIKRLNGLFEVAGPLLNTFPPDYMKDTNYPIHSDTVLKPWHPSQTQPLQYIANEP